MPMETLRVVHTRRVGGAVMDHEAWWVVTGPYSNALAGPFTTRADAELAHASLWLKAYKGRPSWKG